jgi:hypothetical protein
MTQRGKTFLVRNFGRLYGVTASVAEGFLIPPQPQSLPAKAPPSKRGFCFSPTLDSPLVRPYISPMVA